MKPLNVLGISASPRSGGASEYLMERCLDAVREKGGGDVSVKAWSFHAKKIGPCLDCGYCLRKPGCAIKDDFQALHDLWFDADIIVYSVPVYHLGLPGQLKCFIDRLGQSSYLESTSSSGDEQSVRYMKIIAPIAVGMHQASGQEKVLAQLVDHALIMHCIPVTGDSWQCYTGAAGWTQNRESRNPLAELEREGDFSTLSLLEAVKTLGVRAFQTAYLLREGFISGSEYFSRDPVYRYALDRLKDDSRV